MLTLLSLALLAGLLLAGAYWRASERQRSIEAQYPPTGQIVTIGGRNLHVRVVGEGPDLVLIHGAGSNTRDMWEGLGKHLVTHYRVFLVDRPGHGWSERLDPGLSGAFRTDAESPLEQAAILSAAVAELGATNPIVVGHSFGGAVTMAWGLDYPAAALVVISGVTLPWPGKVDISYRILGSTLGGSLLAPLGSAFVPDTYVQFVLENSFAPEALPQDYLTRAGIPLAIRLETLRANNRQVNRLRPFIVEQTTRYDELSLPIEILHGTEDTTVYLDIHAAPLADQLPNAALTTLEGAGHMTHHTRSADILAAIDRAAARAGLR